MKDCRSARRLLAQGSFCETASAAHGPPAPHGGPAHVVRSVLLSSLVVAVVVAIAACSSSSDEPSAPSVDAGPTTSTPDVDAGSDSPSSDAGDASNSGGSCSSARAQLLGSVDSVSDGTVTVLDTTSGVMTVYVDASAGGPAGAATHPWLFLSLATGSKVSVTDVTSTSSTDWDLALKRPVIYTNDGDGGPGQGGAVLVAKDFDAVTAADATGVTFGTEELFDADCNPNVDPTGAAMTTFSTWYDYDPSTHGLTPAAGTWLVHGGKGALYKVKLQTYYGAPDGGVSSGGGGAYVLKIGAL